MYEGFRIFLTHLHYLLYNHVLCTEVKKRSLFSETTHSFAYGVYKWSLSKTTRFDTTLHLRHNSFQVTSTVKNGFDQTTHYIDEKERDVSPTCRCVSLLSKIYSSLPQVDRH